jgi:hypothetical protein
MVVVNRSLQNSHVRILRNIDVVEMPKESVMSDSERILRSGRCLFGVLEEFSDYWARRLEPTSVRKEVVGSDSVRHEPFLLNVERPVRF